MPLFGAHMSVAGGLQNAVTASIELKCETVQIFTKNPNSWVEPTLTAQAIDTFRQALAGAGLRYPTAHDSYLINLASPDDTLFQKSIDALVIELHRAEALGLSYLVGHPGSHTGIGDAAGLARIVAGLNAVRARCPAFAVILLLETTAGQGTALGHRFEHLRTLLDGVADSSWLGVCVDTCHIFAAGYPLGTAEQYAETFQEMDNIIGIKRVKLFHLNDSKAVFRSRVDRHAAIGEGEIGTGAFERLVNDVRFVGLPMILETPKEDSAGQKMDPVNLRVLRAFAARHSKGRKG